MGEILFHTGLAVKVIDGVERLIVRVPGRLAVVAVVAGTVFSAISGSTIATTAMLGSPDAACDAGARLPPHHGHRPIMAIGAVDMLIPPSALTVLLGSLSGISISKLLLGGVVPGLLLSVAFVAWIIVRVRISPHLAPSDTDAVEHQGWDRWQPLFAYVLPTLSIFGVVVGALAAGWATPTECAALGAFATMLLAALYRALRWEAVLKALKGTAGISGMILFIIWGPPPLRRFCLFRGPAQAWCSSSPSRVCRPTRS
jgi:tripartite ATP-independent transporter DctM subunit